MVRPLGSPTPPEAFAAQIVPCKDELGIESMCVAGGMGHAMLIETLN